MWFCHSGADCGTEKAHTVKALLKRSQNVKQTLTDPLQIGDTQRLVIVSPINFFLSPFSLSASCWLEVSGCRSSSILIFDLKPPAPPTTHETPVQANVVLSVSCEIQPENSNNATTRRWEKQGSDLPQNWVRLTKAIELRVKSGQNNLHQRAWPQTRPLPVTPAPFVHLMFHSAKERVLHLCPCSWILYIIFNDAIWN